MENEKKNLVYFFFFQWLEQKKSEKKKNIFGAELNWATAQVYCKIRKKKICIAGWEDGVLQWKVLYCNRLVGE